MKINKLSFLTGVWKGKGIAQYPTIKSVEYEEELVFKKENGFDVIFYEQKTWVKNENEIFNKSIFWESGFILEREENFELCNVQVGGRMEILSGFLYERPNNEFNIEFKSKNIFNDEKMISSGRSFIFSKSQIEYELRMSTTQNPGYDIHLNAVLQKVDSL